MNFTEVDNYWRKHFAYLEASDQWALELRLSVLKFVLPYLLKLPTFARTIWLSIYVIRSRLMSAYKIFDTLLILKSDKNKPTEIAI